LRFAPFYFASVILVSPCHGENFTGKVVKILDGDTITVVHDDTEDVIRLNGIDCPEKNQAYGKKAKEFTSSLVNGKTVTAEEKEVDRDGRIIADVLLEDGTILNHELLKEGLAWWFWKYSKDETLKALEAGARDEKCGLWHDPIPIPHGCSERFSTNRFPTFQTSSILALRH